MSDERLRALERLVDAGEADPRALLALRARARGAPLLPAPVCDDIDGSGWGCTGGEACSGWGWRDWSTEAPVLGECPLPPWSRWRAGWAPSIAHGGEMPDRVLRRELVTGARVLVPTDGRCAPCRGTGGGCAACGGTGWAERYWVDPEGEAAELYDSEGADADPYGDWAAEIDRAQGREPEPCETCRGVGTVDSWQDGMPGQEWCPECGGAG